jgi:hypothetical protein
MKIAGLSLLILLLSSPVDDLLVDIAPVAAPPLREWVAPIMGRLKASADWEPAMRILVPSFVARGRSPALMPSNRPTQAPSSYG